MKILIISPRNKPIVNFRGDLIRDMIVHGNTVFAVGPDRELYDEIMDLGIERFIEIPFVRDNTSVRGDIQYYRALKRCIREIQPDMVFSYTAKPVIYGSLAAAACKTPHIYSMCPGLGRTFSSTGAKAATLRRLMWVLYRSAFSKCDNVIFQNPDDIQKMTEGKYIKKEKCRLVNGSGVNMERFVHMPLPDSPCFLMLSRIIRDKGVFEYLEAARKVRRRYPDARFVLLGRFDTSFRGLSREDLAPYIDDGTVFMPGEVKDPINYFRDASVCVLPSYYHEGLPRTILEAMSCGRPVITTDWPGCREPVEDGVNGFLVPIKDSDTLADRMILLIENRTLAEKMAEAAYKICRERYDVRIVNDQMQKILQY